MTPIAMPWMDIALPLTVGAIGVALYLIFKRRKR